jgi:hypothetical protein
MRLKKLRVVIDVYSLNAGNAALTAPRRFIADSVSATFTRVQDLGQKSDGSL